MINFFTNEYVKIQKNFVELCREILKTKFKDKILVFYVHSYGCQGNVSEGEKIEGILKEIGYEKGNNPKYADLIILNTCAIREKAQDKVFSRLGEILNLKLLDESKIIGLCGCMVQQEHVKNKIKNKFPSVDLIFGTHVIHKLPEFLYYILNKDKKQNIDISSKEVIEESIPILRHDKIKALVPISYGCNNFCSYCIVPYVKGRERSRKINFILDEIKSLVEKGYKEVTLLGQNVNSYGNDLNLKYGFADLLYKINEINKDFKIRFMTSHPKDFTKHLVDVISQCPKVYKHFHLPVQSGSDKILKEMNRKYDTKQYMNIIEYTKKIIPNATFSTDIIVGFPGETYDDFKKTLKLIEKVKYISIFNFIFSKRVGTKAASMEDLISKEEKTKWLQELINMQNDISLNNNQKYVGKIENVLFDGVFKNNEQIMTGRSESNILVLCKNNKEKIGEFANVKIKKANRTLLEGDLI